MVARKANDHWFYGCSKYPTCKTTLTIAEAKVQYVVATQPKKKKKQEKAKNKNKRKRKKRKHSSTPNMCRLLVNAANDLGINLGVIIDDLKENNEQRRKLCSTSEYGGDSGSLMNASHCGTKNLSAASPVVQLSNSPFSGGLCEATSSVPGGC